MEAERKGSLYQACFGEAHIGCSIAGIDVITRGPREKCTYACVGCTLAMTRYGPVFSTVVVADHKKRLEQTNLQAFRYVLNLSAERPVRVLYADAMCSHPLLVCSKYLQRHQAQPHLHGLQRHGYSTVRVNRGVSSLSRKKRNETRLKGSTRHLKMILVESLS